MGALTLKPFSDELREWEFIENEGVDPTDSFGVSLRLSIREDQIFLAEPGDLETPWITDRGRLFFDGLFNKKDKNQNLWGPLFDYIEKSIYFTDQLTLQKISPSFFTLIFENIGIESLSILYLICQKNSNIKLRISEKNYMNTSLESELQLNSATKNYNLQQSDLCFLLNTNTRNEGYLLNLKLRQRFYKGNFKILSIGPFLDLTFPVINLGSNINIFSSICSGNHFICQDLEKNSFPLLISNTNIFKQKNLKHLAKMVKYLNVLTLSWNGFHILNDSLYKNGINSLYNFLPLTEEDFLNLRNLYLINVSVTAIPNLKNLLHFKLLNLFIKKNEFFILNQNKELVKNFETKLNYKNFNNYIDLPTSLFLESSESFFNTEGTIKRTVKLLNFQKKRKSEWQIFRKIYSTLFKLNNLGNKKNYKLINFNCLTFINYKSYLSFNYYATNSLTSLSSFLTVSNKPILKMNTYMKKPKLKVFNSKLKFFVDDFFLNEKDFFTKNSSVLINCSKMVRQNSTNFF